MFYKSHFPKSGSREAIEKEACEEGFNPILIKDPPGFIYKSHKHRETKFLACLEGSMQVIVENQKYVFEPVEE